MLPSLSHTCRIWPEKCTSPLCLMAPCAMNLPVSGYSLRAFRASFSKSPEIAGYRARLLGIG
jgi:hypothetical protein